MIEMTWIPTVIEGAFWVYVALGILSLVAAAWIPKTLPAKLGWNDPNGQDCSAEDCRAYWLHLHNKTHARSFLKSALLIRGGVARAEKPATFYLKFYNHHRENDRVC